MCHNCKECFGIYQKMNLPLETWFVQWSVFYRCRSLQCSHLDCRNSGGHRSEGAGLTIFLKFYDFRQFLLGRKNIQSQNHIPESWCWLINVHTEIDKHNEEKLYKEAQGKVWKNRGKKKGKARKMRRNFFFRVVSTSDEEAVDKLQLW